MKNEKSLTNFPKVADEKQDINFHWLSVDKLIHA